MSFFEELKRRNVFRVGLAYAVGAWLLLQLTEVLSELLSLPAEVGPVVVAIVVIGFPIVLFAAWAYELTPQGIKRESEVQAQDSITRSTGRKLNGLITVMLALAVAYLLYDKFLAGEAPVGAEQAQAEAAREAELVAPANDTTAPPAQPVPRQSIAVIPFTNRSPVADDEFFIDGIHDDLLTNLARIGGIKVISRTSVARFRDTEIPIPEIARQLGVATVMEGAVQRAGDTVRINVQLIDAETDEHLWAQIYDRPLTTDNLFAVQSEISEAIASALQATLTPEESRRINERPTQNLAAYSAYLRGMRAFERREVESMRSALADFQRAVELDPDFALGWAGIAQVAEVLPSWSDEMTREEGQALSIPAAERAMALAPDSGEANLALAMVLEGDEAIAQFEKTLELLPNHAMAHQWYANTLQGPPGPGWNKALALLRKATELDPISPNHRSQVARQLIFMNRQDEAIRELEVVAQADPDYAPVYGFLGWAEMGRGNFDQSIAWSERYMAMDSETGFPQFDIVMSLSHLDDRERLRDLRDAFAADDPDADIVRLADLMLAIRERRYAAIGEIIGDRPLGPDNGAAVGRALHQTYSRDYPAAYLAWRQAVPGLFEAEGRPEAIRDFADLACLVADVARRVGEPDLAQALITDTVSYLENELPRYQERAAAEGNLHFCFAAMGDVDATLDQMESNLRDRYFEFWWEPRHLELFEPFQGDPRFEQVMQGFEDEMARQRASLDRMDAEAQRETGP